mgnify:CR=1 FL=1
MRRSLLHKLKGYSLDKIKDSCSFHSSVQTLYEYRGNQHYDLKDNPILDLEYHKSEERDTWATPKSLIARLEAEFGKFDLDSFATEENKICSRHFNKEQNALLQDWDGNLIFCNPPYSQKNEVIQKCHIEAEKGRKIILLVPAFTETKWFAEMKVKSDWLL